MIHAIDRALARYGISLVVDDLKQIVDDIQNNRGTFIKKMEDGTTVWLVEVKTKLCKVVISSDFWRVITFLPANAYCTLNAKGELRKHHEHKRFVRSERGLPSHKRHA